jgi:hypothetical protein
MISQATIVGVSDVKVLEIAAYDDWEGGIIRIEMSTSIPECPVGSYLDPKKPGYDQLYALLMVMATTGRTARFQLYNNHIKSGLCEVDAIRLRF